MLDYDIPMIKELMQIFRNEITTQVGRVANGNNRGNLGEDIAINGFKLGFSNTRTLFNEEDSNSPYYNNVKELTGTAYLDVIDKTIPIPGASFSNSMFTVGAYLKFSGQLGVAFEEAKVKLFFEEEYKPKSKSLELFGALTINGGAGLLTNEGSSQLSGVRLHIDAFLSYPLETKLKYEWYPSSSSGIEKDPLISREFNHGPAFITVNINVRAEDRSRASSFDWDLINVNWSYALTDKVFNKCCFEFLTPHICVECQ